MVSGEFKAAVSSGNLLRMRIMLKDSLIVDSTFYQFNEMLDYAKKYHPQLLVPVDENFREEDSSSWNQQVMDLELVRLVNNFSEVRIDYLKK